MGERKTYDGGDDRQLKRAKPSAEPTGATPGPSGTRQMPSPIPGPSGVQRTPSPTPPCPSGSQQPGRKRKPTVPLKKGTKGTKGTTKKRKHMKVNKFTKEHVSEDEVGTKKAFKVHLCLTAVIDSIDSLAALPTLEEKKEFLKGMGKVNAFLDGHLAKFNIINNEVNARICQQSPDLTW
ncbi:hypothetical protein AAF712_013150 [Marasmius tenuissimus]|uniref:Uncharacterized protein n=1 Tax=Marasmius tenuissimus TaxID=585030 RepID=A0ABR2ZGJ1_9AGAR